MSEPVIPEPDDKDWTWTLRRPCPDCGFDAGGTAAAEVPRIVDDVVSRFTVALAAADASTRPAPQVWSVTEYGCHVRDVCDVFDGRLWNSANRRSTMSIALRRSASSPSLM
jgi:hypothetical protein